MCRYVARINLEVWECGKSESCKIEKQLIEFHIKSYTKGVHMLITEIILKYEFPRIRIQLYNLKVIVCIC